MDLSPDLRERYGRRPAWQRPVLYVALAVLVAAFLSWVAWAAWFHGTPDVTSELTAYTIVDEHTAEARLDVRLADGVTATCLLRATAADHTTVGELSFTPVDGRNDVTIRTERRATAIEKVGCTSPDQPQPR